ncbi:MAG: penicillin acylase family protein, partial [Bacteroidetes bacterium]
MIKRILIVLAVLIVVALLGSFVFYQSLKPDLQGELTLEGPEQEVEVYFDEYGIPHIYAQSETDAQFALGYVHAQDRLFQMEMMRRLGHGRLSEILGPDFVKTDRFFRTLGIGETAREAAQAFNQLPDDDPVKRAALAYFKGVNAFMESGPTPIEFRILGIEKAPFTPEDAYAIFGYMAFSFAQAFRTDPLVTRIHDKLGAAYLADLDVHWNPMAQVIPTFSGRGKDSLLSDGFNIDKLFETLPVRPFIGSNGWVIGPSKTKSGKVIFSNDTHIAYSSPSVWYEAHIEYPGLSLYGNYLGGIPFAVIGHNRHHAIGLTMLENDDIDFYLEKINPENPGEVWFKDHWEPLRVRRETIHVKGAEDVVFEVKETRHGPIVNEALDHVAHTTDQPVSVWWIYTKFLPKNLESAYWMGRSKTMAEVKKAVSLGHAPGLNVMYGDVEGNIAWWSYGKLPRRPAHVNSKLFLDGSTGTDEVEQFFDFEDNPHAENPPWGFVYSANNQPDTMAGYLHPGYYIPEDRARRIWNLLSPENEWD